MSRPLSLAMVTGRQAARTKERRRGVLHAASDLSLEMSALSWWFADVNSASPESSYYTWLLAAFFDAPAAAPKTSSPDYTPLLNTLAACMTAAVMLFLWLRPRKRMRAGCVPLRVNPSGRMAVLLVQSRKHPEFWTFPAGGVERGERDEQAAARETREEAGVVGQLGRRVCKVSDAKSTTTMYALYVEAELETWDEASVRTRQWFDLGVPGSPMAVQCFAAVRQRLRNKPNQLQCIAACERVRVELAREGEQRESQWGPPPKRRPSPTK